MPFIKYKKKDLLKLLQYHKLQALRQVAKRPGREIAKRPGSEASRVVRFRWRTCKLSKRPATHLAFYLYFMYYILLGCNIKPNNSPLAPARILARGQSLHPPFSLHPPSISSLQTSSSSLLPSPLCRSFSAAKRPPQMHYGVWGSAVSSPSVVQAGVWGSVVQGGHMTIKVYFAPVKRVDLVATTSVLFVRASNASCN